jgi:hypothetical protein
MTTATNTGENHKGSSVYALLITNLLTIVFAVYQGWSVREVMLIYWSQSVVIGFFNVKRMLALTEFSTDGVTMNNRAVDPTPGTKRSMALFFALHYGMFHAVYLVFLIVDSQALRSISVVPLLLCVVAFIINHGYSYSSNLERDLARKPNIGTIMFFPYARILPMHLTIIFGGAMAGASTFSLVLFLLLKTLADVIMHVVEHSSRKFPGKRKPRKSEAS